MTLLARLLFLPGLVVGLSVHEFAHAWLASLLGDDYPRRQGRVSLNPFRHLAPLGTLAILVLPFGWAKPVPVNLYNFKRPKRDYLLCSLAGPAANLVVATLCFGLMQITRHSLAVGPAGPFFALGHVLLLAVAQINVMLATINLLPIPPLDGSKIWQLVFPGLKPASGGKATWIFIALLLALVWTGSLGKVIGFVLNGTGRLLPALDREVVIDQRQAGAAAHARQDYAQAERHFTGALEIDPRDRECLYSRALAREQLGRHRDALADVTRAMELAEPPAGYYDFRARLHEALGQPDEAAADRARAEALRAVTRPGAEIRPASGPAPPGGRSQ